jgi:hypothetical protein
MNTIPQNIISEDVAGASAHSKLIQFNSSIFSGDSTRIS